MGKHKPIYDKSCTFPAFLNTIMSLICILVDCGDYVVVTNAKHIKVTGRKDEQLVYRKHTMFPGGLKETEYKDMMENKPYEVRSVVHCIRLYAYPVLHERR
jgi:large subunit ribosomal protein L13